MTPSDVNNPDQKLVRFEILECLVRIALAKYPSAMVCAHRIARISSKVVRHSLDDQMVMFGHLVSSDQLASLLDTYCPILYPIFKKWCSYDRGSGRMVEKDIVDFAKAFDLIDANLSHRQLMMAFSLSMDPNQEVTSSEWMWSFSGFVQAVCRMAQFKYQARFRTRHIRKAVEDNNRSRSAAMAQYLAASPAKPHTDSGDEEEGAKPRAKKGKKDGKRGRKKKPSIDEEEDDENDEAGEGEEENADDFIVIEVENENGDQSVSVSTSQKSKNKRQKQQAMSSDELTFVEKCEAILKLLCYSPAASRAVVRAHLSANAAGSTLSSTRSSLRQSIAAPSARSTVRNSISSRKRDTISERATLRASAGSSFLEQARALLKPKSDL